MRRYYTYTVKKLVSVQHLVTIEYIETKPDFSYPEESHNFYEFIVVESGNITCKKEDSYVDLGKNDFLLIRPNTPHSYFIKDGKSANIIIICFKSKSSIISDLKDKYYLEPDNRELVKKILETARSAFVFPFDKKLTLKSNPRPGSQQLIENYIEEILINLFQLEIHKEKDVQIMTDTLGMKRSVSAEIVKILEDNLYGRITLADICETMYYSKTYLGNIFKEINGITVMQYYQNLKIKEASTLLKKDESIKSIAEKLCYESPQHFAKMFKQKTGKTPTEYRKKHK